MDLGFVLLFLTVIGSSFICSLFEAVFLSITPAYVGVLVKEGKKSGQLLEHLKDNINRPISAILTLNTIANTLGAAAIGAHAQEKFNSTAITVVSIVLTFGILIFSEIIPKILGATYWKTLAPIAAYFIQFIITALYPIVWLSEVIKKLMTGDQEQPTVTREEMISTVELGADEGTLHKKESAIIKNLLMLNNIFVSDIMTPRSVFFALESDDTVEEVANKFRPIRFSRIPVYNQSLDNIIGLVHRYKILEELSRDHHNTQVKDLVTPIQSVPERMSVAAAIDFFVKTKEHLALAVDEYGVITGLVTLEDAIETLLGVEIVDEFDNITDMRQYALDQWQLRKAQFRKT